MESGRMSLTAEVQHASTKCKGIKVFILVIYPFIFGVLLYMCANKTQVSRFHLGKSMNTIGPKRPDREEPSLEAPNSSPNVEPIFMNPRPLEMVWPFTLWPSPKSCLRNLDLNKFETRDRDFLEKKLQEMVSRAEAVSSYCLQRGRSENVFGDWSNFVFIINNPNIIYCPILKAGSRFISSYLLFADGKKIPNNNNNNKNNNIDDLNMLESDNVTIAWKLQDYAKFKAVKLTLRTKSFIFKYGVRTVAVRHPFERLASTFRHNVLNKSLRKLSKRRNKKVNETKLFERFVDSVIKNKIRGKSDQEIDSILQQSKACDACQFDPVVVMKHETLEEDLKFLAFVANLNLMRNIQFVFEKSESNGSGSLENLFSKIPLKKIQALYKVYEEDFLMFNYSTEGYL